MNVKRLLSMVLKDILKLIAWTVLVGSCIWAYYDFGFEPAIASVVALGGLLGLWIDENSSNKKTPIVKQKQRSGKNSTSNQAAGDINIYNSGRDIKKS